MQGILITNIKWKGVYNLFIRESKEFFQDQCTNDYIHWGIMSGRALTVKRRKRRLIDFRKDVLCKLFRPRLIRQPFFPISKIYGNIKETKLL